MTQTSDPDPHDAAALLRALAAPETYPGRPPVRAHETHASWVFVAGERAYKVKKPLALGFLDYSTLARRRAACREEVLVNRALAPDIYLGVRAIVVGDASEAVMGPGHVGTPSATPPRAHARGGHFRIADETAPNALEYAVEMRTFDEHETLAGLIESGSLSSEHVEAVARRLAEFHRDTEVVGDWEPQRALRTWQKNVEELRAVGPPAEWDIDLADSFGAAFVAAHAQELRERAQRGLIRDGHGDLRCEHVLAAPHGARGGSDRVRRRPAPRGRRARPGVPSDGS